VNHQLGDSLEQDASIGTTHDVFDELLSHQQLLQVYGAIPEISLLVAGRAPELWWPPPDSEVLPSSGSLNVLAGESTDAAATATTGPATSDSSRSASNLPLVAAAAARDVLDDLEAAAPVCSASSRAALLDQEVGLVAIRFQGAQLCVSVSGEGLSAEVAMAALTVDDLLVGLRNPAKAHMARSSTAPLQLQPSWAAAGATEPAASATQEAGGTARSVPELTPSPGVQTGGPAAQLQVTPSIDPGGLGVSASPSNSGSSRSDNDSVDEFFDAEEGDATALRGLRRSSRSSRSSSTAAAADVHADTAVTHVQTGSSRVVEPLQLLSGIGYMGAGGNFVPAPSFAAAMASFSAAQDAAGPSATTSSRRLGDSTGRESTVPGNEQLVRLRFSRFSPTAPSYSGLDMEVGLTLSSLTFYCNRPTVAALMAFGADLATISTAVADEQGAVAQVRVLLRHLFMPSHQHSARAGLSVRLGMRGNVGAINSILPSVLVP
jgi:hypothetical protein